MTHSISPKNWVPTSALWPIVFVALVGLVDAAYLTFTHYSGESVMCTVQSGCDEVLGSPFSTIGDIPIALFGALYYATMIGLGVMAARGSATANSLLKWLSLSAFAVSCYLVYLQLFVIHAICQYCMVSFGACTLLFLMSWDSVRWHWNPNRRLAGEL